MKKILVVDDDDDVLETIQLVLEIGGYDIEPLNDAELIFDRINEFEPDLILLSIILYLKAKAGGFSQYNLPIKMILIFIIVVVGGVYLIYRFTT